MDPRDALSNEVSDDDLNEINRQLALADPFDAVPFNGVVFGDFDTLEREFEAQLAEDIEHANNFVPAPGRIRIDCAWKLGEQTSRALLSSVAAAAALTAGKRAEPTSATASRDGQPPQPHAGPGGHATPHLALTPRLQDQDPARA